MPFTVEIKCKSCGKLVDTLDVDDYDPCLTMTEFGPDFDFEHECVNGPWKRRGPDDEDEDEDEDEDDEQ